MARGASRPNVKAKPAPAQGVLPFESVRDPSKSIDRKLERYLAMASAVNELFEQALLEKPTQYFDSYVESICRLRHLSAFNAMLVHAQRPEHASVATSAQWRRAGRKVLPGAIPIVVLQPFGPVMFLFEADDTSGYGHVPNYGASFQATGVLTERDWADTCNRAAEYGIRVRVLRLGANLAGTAQGISDIPTRDQRNRWLIRVNAKHDAATRFATLTHELGHIYCGHCGSDPKGRWPERGNLGYSARELEAEAVAWLVCRRMGLETRSKEYLSSLATEENVREVARNMGMYAIVRAVEHVEWDAARRSASGAFG